MASTSPCGQAPFRDDGPLLDTTPRRHVKRGCPHTGGFGVVLPVTKPCPLARTTTRAHRSTSPPPRATSTSSASSSRTAHRYGREAAGARAGLPCITGRWDTSWLALQHELGHALFILHREPAATSLCLAVTVHHVAPVFVAPRAQSRPRQFPCQLLPNFSATAALGLTLAPDAAPDAAADADAAAAPDAVADADAGADADADAAADADAVSCAVVAGLRCTAWTGSGTRPSGRLSS